MEIIRNSTHASKAMANVASNSSYYALAIRRKRIAAAGVATTKQKQ